jgi:hypothetical protein
MPAGFGRSFCASSPSASLAWLSAAASKQANEDLVYRNDALPLLLLCMLIGSDLTLSSTDGQHRSSAEGVDRANSWRSFFMLLQLDSETAV